MEMDTLELHEVVGNQDTAREDNERARFEKALAAARNTTVDWYYSGDELYDNGVECVVWIGRTLRGLVTFTYLGVLLVIRSFQLLLAALSLV